MLDNGKAKSLIGKAKDKDCPEVKKDDYFKVLYTALNIETGHNVRDISSPEAQEHIHNMYLSIMAGVDMPCLDIRTSADGKIYVVDGECRYHAYGLAIKDGKQIEYIRCMEDKGNDANRTVKMLTRNQGLALTPLETALGYQRLMNMCWEVDEIANHMGRSAERVKQLLVLAGANSDVHQFVRKGLISSDHAIDLVRIHGENTGAHIADKLEDAAHQGKSRLTKATVQGRALPKKVISGLVSSVSAFAERLDRATRESLAALENQSEESLQGKTIQVDAATLLALLKANSAIDEEKAKQSEKLRQKEDAAKQLGLPV